LGTSLNIFPRAFTSKTSEPSTQEPVTATKIQELVQQTIAKYIKGSVIFQGSEEGKFSENNQNFFWDDANAFLAIGTNVPDSRLTIAGKVDGATLLSIKGEDQDKIFTATNDGAPVTNIDYQGNLAIAGSLSDLNDSTLNVASNLATGGDISVGGGDITSSKDFNLYSTASTNLGASSSETRINGANITLNSANKIYFDDTNLTSSIKLTDTSTSLPNSKTGIVDAINDAWNRAGSVSSTPSFSSIASGTNTGAAMVVGTGASLTYSGTGTINTSSLEGGTWAAPGTIGSTTPNTGAFTTLTTNGNLVCDSTGANCLNYWDLALGAALKYHMFQKVANSASPRLFVPASCFDPNSNRGRFQRRHRNS
jgi:hypothetical protein